MNCLNRVNPRVSGGVFVDIHDKIFHDGTLNFYFNGICKEDFMSSELLKGKKVLIVDDESDVLDTLEQLLPMCTVTKASSFDKTKELLESQYFDLAILDIMGVNGYELLRIANEKGVTAIMLTAHALTIDHTIRAVKEGAASYIPKEELVNIVIFLNDLLEAREKGKSSWWRWLMRFGSLYNRKFGPEWQSKDKEFWDKFPYNI
jgi:CheY-like chemotaxis protein